MMFVLGIIMFFFSMFLVYRFHMIDKRCKNRSKIACLLIALSFLGKAISPAFILQESLGETYVVNSSFRMVTDILCDISVLFSSICFVWSLMGILETSSKRQKL